MKFTKMTIFAVLIAFVAISMWVTFQQDAFLTPVEAKLLFIPTKPIPVIYYIATAFIVGLVIGVFIAIHEHLVMAKRIRVIKKEHTEENKSLKEQIDALTSSIEAKESSEE